MNYSTSPATPDAKPVNSPANSNLDKNDDKALSRFLSAVMVSIGVGILICFAPVILFIVTAATSRYQWSTQQSVLSPDGTQRAKIIYQGRGWMDDDEIRLKIVGGPADKTYADLGDVEPNIRSTSASFQIRWVSNHELHIADQRGSLKDWTVARITADGILIDRRSPSSNFSQLR